MGIVRRNRAFLITAALILVVGAALFGGVVAVRVFAAAGATPAAAPPAPASYNTVSSYGMTGYAPLKLTPDRRDPVLHHLAPPGAARHRAPRLLSTAPPTTWRCSATSTTSRRSYGADSSFMSFEARKTTELGDTLQQLRVSNPPVLAVIRGSGEVAELYTGWIGHKVMEQVVADAVRGL